MSVFSVADLRFFDENGYVVLSQAVPGSNLEAAVAAIWEFLGMDPGNPNDWYRLPHHPGGMVEIYHHQALWDNRQHPRVYQAFAQLLQTEALWVSEDRASMKPPAHPNHPDYDHKGFIHWDLDTAKPLSATLRLQGVLCLTDTSAEMGGFQCIPGFHKNLDQWIAQQPPDRNPRKPDLARVPEGMAVTPVTGKAGDLIIWNNLLAHGNGHNTSDRPRLAQYISMSPARQNNEEARRARIERHEKRLTYKDGDERRWEELHGKSAQLTPLGRKLLGLDVW